jgi:hypothetical protein
MTYNNFIRKDWPVREIMGKILNKPPLRIPGKIIQPPDGDNDARCPYCRRTFQYPKKIVDPKTRKVKFVCPHCNREL